MRTYADVCSLYSCQVLLLRGVIPRIEAVAETLLRPLAPTLPDLMQEHQMSLAKVSGPGGSLVKMPTLPEGNRSQEHINSYATACTAYASACRLVKMPALPEGNRSRLVELSDADAAGGLV
jgi:hypothetical protein